MSDTTFGGDPIWPVSTEYNVQFSLSCGYVIVAPDGRESTLGYANEGQARSVAAKMTEAYAAGAASSAALLREVREVLEKIADAPANGPGGELYYEVTDPETGQTDTMHVDPIGWIGDAANKARAALAKLPKEAPPASSPRA